MTRASAAVSPPAISKRQARHGKTDAPFHRRHPVRRIMADNRSMVRNRANHSPLIAGTRPLAVSLKTLAAALDADRESVRRWLRQAGIRPVALGRGRNGAIRYLWQEVEGWLSSQEHVD